MAEDRLARVKRLERIARIRDLEAQIPNEQASADERKRVEESRAFDRPYDAALSAAQDSATFGYAPQISAGVGVVTEKLASFIPGTTANILKKKAQAGEAVPKRDYQALKNEEVLERDLLRKHNPKASLGGAIGGAVLQAPLMSAGLAKAGIGAGGGLLARAGKSTGIGATQGLLQNPGEAGVEADPFQIRERIEGAKTGALFGAGGEIAGSALGAGARAIGRAPEKLQSYASGKALKSSGAMLKDFRKLMGKGRADEVGEFAIKEGLIRPGADFESIAEETGKALQDTGEEIGAIYNRVGARALNPTELGNKLTSAVVKDMPKLKADKYTGEMKDLIEEITTNPQVQSGDVKAMNEVIGDIDDLVNWSKKSSELPAIQQGYIKLRGALRNEVNNIAEASGNRGLIDLNKRYQNLKELNNISRDRVARETGNAMLGLRDTGIGIGLGGAATVAGGDTSPEGLLRGAALGAGAAALSKGMRSYGNPLLTQGALGAGKVLGNVRDNMRGLIPDRVGQGLLQQAVDPRVQLLNSIRASQSKKN